MQKWEIDKQNQAVNWARANKSDPFAYSVAMAHYNSGVAKLGDYDVEMRLEEVTLADGQRVTREIPHNMKRP